MSQQSPLEQLEVQKKRLEQLSARRQAIQVKLESARQQYAQAAKEAEAAYKTSNLDELRAILVKLEAENTAAMAEFDRALGEFEAHIVRIENALANPEAMNELLLSMPAPSAAAPAATASAPAALVFAEDDI